jgi:3-dehydroquinate synthase
MEYFFENFFQCSLQKLYLVADDQNVKEFHGIRTVLNFGHTIGHAVEGYCFAHKIPMSHGRAVFTGIYFMITDLVLRNKVQLFVKKELKISPFLDFEPDDLAEYLIQDKKMSEDFKIRIIFLKGLTDIDVVHWTVEELVNYIKEVKK